MTNTKPAQLIYLTDPHCGWCCGYSKTITNIVEHYRDDERVGLRLVAGGLFHPALSLTPGFADDKRPIAARIEERFGVQFSEDYFKNVLGPGRLDSLVPCRAINAVEFHAAGAAFPFASALVAAAFLEGRNISEPSVCLDVAQQIGFDRQVIASLLQSKEVDAMTMQSFEFARTVGTGFPSLFLQSEDAVTHLGGVELDLRRLELLIDAQLG